MGSAQISCSTSKHDNNNNNNNTQIVLNVYDLTPANNYTYWLGFGIFHSGIEDDISWRLTGKHIPGWVNRLAWLGALCVCLPPERLQSTTVKQLLQYHECTEDGTEPLSTTTSLASTEIDDTDQEKLLLSPSGVVGTFLLSKRPICEEKLIPRIKIWRLKLLFKS